MVRVPAWLVELAPSRHQVQAAGVKGTAGTAAAGVSGVEGGGGPLTLQVDGRVLKGPGR